ncbi:S-adenosyl-L-methionine-dependent methyltransferase [Thelonectria olida]|uniref:S-adenosyl-L-methionine-dependent methyltransferase n=1 Tax=Thelonectria olida TaxID=1576542 RepID=A0A9P8WCH2_9HYPO|nr:S-adenosyl-L-methionine-dependent methyltransferase [Thelonectria olida]
MAPPPTALQSVEASPRVHDLLQRLHAASSAQERSLSQTWFYISRLLSHYIWGTGWTASADDHMRDKFVSLEEDKCQFVYLLARSIGARNIVEAGTSFGVSTIYLALAVGQNVKDARALGKAVTGKVVGTEKEPTKVAKAREHWKQAGDEVEPWIEVREGDLRETLAEEEGMPDEVDMLLLDIWTPLALPALEIVKPRLRRGAMVLVDNTTMAKPMYKDLLAFLHDPKNGFRTTTTPYSGGLEMAVYLPSAEGV